MSPTDARKYAYNTLLDSSPPSNVILPLTLQPTLPTVNGSSGVAQFFMLQDGKTGVLALGSFAATSFADLQDGLLTGLQGLKNSGAQKLIVDLTGNGGGEYRIPRLIPILTSPHLRLRMHCAREF